MKILKKNIYRLYYIIMWGYEYIADCGDCDYDKLHSLENIQAFIDELCERTCMKKMGPLHSHYLEDNEYKKKKI